MKQGKFIVLEGLDGSGKGTQAELLAAELRRQGRAVYMTAEPTNSSLGGMIRDALGGFIHRDAYELSAMFLADRIFHNVNPVNGIRQALSKGMDVVCDRYYYSSFAYQGKDADLDWVMDMNLNCPEILKPDLCIFLDIDPDTCDERITGRGMAREIYESAEQQRKVRQRFYEVFERLKDRENVRIVDATRTIPEVSAEINILYQMIKEN